jgi:hypothetical protein
VDFPPTALFHWIRRRKFAFNLSITSPDEEISAKQFLVVNLRRVFDIGQPFRHKEAISEHLPNLGISFSTKMPLSCASAGRNGFGHV